MLASAGRSSTTEYAGNSHQGEIIAPVSSLQHLARPAAGVAPPAVHRSSTLGTSTTAAQSKPARRSSARRNTVQVPTSFELSRKGGAGRPRRRRMSDFTALRSARKPGGAVVADELPITTGTAPSGVAVGRTRRRSVSSGSGGATAVPQLLASPAKRPTTAGTTASKGAVVGSVDGRRSDRGSAPESELDRMLVGLQAKPVDDDSVASTEDDRGSESSSSDSR